MAITNEDIDAAFSEPSGPGPSMPPVSAPTATKTLAVAKEPPQSIPISEQGRLQLSDYNQAIRLAMAVYASKMFPESWVKAGADEKAAVACVAICLLFGREVGFGLTQTFNCVYVVNGKPCLYGDGPIAKVYDSGLLHSITDVWSGEGDKLQCTVTVRRKQSDGTPSEPHARTFGVADAIAQGWTTREKFSLWKVKGQHRRMCQCRARAWVLRDVFPDVLMGLAVAEEFEEFGTAPTQDTTIGAKLAENP